MGDGGRGPNTTYEYKHLVDETGKGLRRFLFLVVKIQTIVLENPRKGPVDQLRGLAPLRLRSITLIR